MEDAELDTTRISDTDIVGASVLSFRRSIIERVRVGFSGFKTIFV